ncbi:hypothetical protein MmiHf6_18160 [Methanimicrococcus hongohii]|uniref:Uncharacterized protein n=1 Tax=Methanimicrococcus hongohii TaxID=3028295 RepID=A0AA96V143_9EURY|nr:hypothetical protein MmiHf6_18160 [Methanimicrococcus sp. Hf6]
MKNCFAIFCASPRNTVARQKTQDMLPLPAAARELLRFYCVFQIRPSFLFYFEMKPKHPIFKIGEPERPIKPKI